MHLKPRKISPEDSQRFLTYLGMAIHCHDSHEIYAVGLDNGEFFVSLCAENCPTHFEITFRSQPQNLSTDSLIVILCRSLWDTAAVAQYYGNGIQLVTAGFTMQILHGQMEW